MKETIVSDYPKMHISEDDVQSRCTLYVCLSCRDSGTPREPKENRQGFILYKNLLAALSESPLKHQVDIKPTKCLSICPRPCGIALASSGSWTYLFGDQKPNDTVHEILECLSVYLNTNNGFMAREKRPISLRGSILGRVPPMQGDRKCT